jgi:hypothetical protein
MTGAQQEKANPGYLERQRHRQHPFLHESIPSGAYTTATQTDHGKITRDETDTGKGKCKNTRSIDHQCE